MLWFFEREAQSLRLETRYDNDSSEYVVIVHWPDGREETERFTDQDTYRRRLVELENRLETDHWSRQGPPVVLPNGWPNKRLT